MSEHFPNDARNFLKLLNWLEVATDKLSAPAKERIRLEIEAHFADAVEAHVADGLSEAEAQAAALAELGDAQAAAKRFRKRHLTEKEAELVEKNTRGWSRTKWAFLASAAYPLPLLLMLFLARDELRHVSLVVPGLACLTGMISPLIWLFYRKRHPIKASLRFRVLLTALELSNVLIFFTWFASVTEQPAYFISFMPVLLWRTFGIIRIWLKLGNSGDTPPAQST